MKDSSDLPTIFGRKVVGPKMVCFLIAILTWTFTTLAQVDLGPDLEKIRAQYHLPGMSAMAIKGGRIVAQGVSGVRRQGNSEPLLLTDRINIGSCTKWMTATVAARLVDRGTLKWDTRVRDLFPNYQEFREVFHNATLDQLLAHRAGVQQGITFESRYWNVVLERPGSVQEVRRWVVDTIFKDPAEVSPGQYLYSNQGYTAAAVMLELASGKTWEALMQEEIFDRLRLASGGFEQVFDGTLPPQNAVGHDLPTGSRVAVPRAAFGANYVLRYQASTGPGGYVACTMRDWAKFLHMQAMLEGSDYLSADTGRRLQSRLVSQGEYGLGVLVVQRGWGAPGNVLTHAGDIFGQNTIFWMAPAHDFAALIYVNCRSADNSVPLAMDAIAGMLVTHYTTPPPKGPLLEPAAISPPKWENGLMSFDYSSLPGVSYLVESTQDFRTWFPIEGSSHRIATNWQTKFQKLSDEPAPYYRIRSEP